MSDYKTCDLFICDKPHYARGLCDRHYQNWRRNGVPISLGDATALLEWVDKFRELTQDLTGPYVEEKGKFVGTCPYCNKFVERMEDHAPTCVIRQAISYVERTEQPVYTDKETENADV